MPFFTHGDTKNKLVLLYILFLGKAPLTHDQLYRVVDRTDSMTFFEFETLLPALESDGFVASFSRPFGDCYALTEAGQEQVQLFADTLPATQREKLAAVLAENAAGFRRETQTTARISGNERDGYRLELLVLDGKETVFCIQLAVASEEAALVMRSRWEAESGPLYDHIWKTLYEGTTDGTN